MPPMQAAEAELHRIDRLGARCLFRGAAAYPVLLDQIEAAPPMLIVKGDPALLARRAVAIVGARNASGAAVRFARMLAHDLGEQGWLVVSGLARGIDTAAHVGSIATGTAAVIAGGIDVVYPPENDALQRDIAERGLLIAEQPHALRCRRVFDLGRVVLEQAGHCGASQPPRRPPVACQSNGGRPNERPGRKLVAAASFRT